MIIIVKLREILKERGITQKELAQMTGIREAGISELANNSRTSLNKEHLIKVAEALGITKIEDLVQFQQVEYIRKGHSE